MKSFLAGIVFTFCAFTSLGQSASATWSVKFSNAIVSRYTPTINAMTSKGWEYSNTIILHGMEKVYNQVTTAAYLNYIQAFVDTYVNTDGTFKPAVTLTSLDRIHPGISLLFLYEKTGLIKYKTAATTLRNLVVGPSATYSKTWNGILWHKLSGYNNISMLDGMYMGHPFLAKYGAMFGDDKAIDTAVNQVLFIYSQLYDNTTHLIKHAWTSTPASYSGWANATTGNSSEVWSRAMGWYVMALVDILKYVPAAHPKRANLLTALSNLAIGIKAYQDATTKLWFQVVDKGGSAGNYIETSGSGMFIYALKTAIDSGWISSATYLSTVQNAWTGLQNYITTYAGTLGGGGGPEIEQFAPAMSVQNNYSAYVSITAVNAPTPHTGAPSGTQNPHGYAAILMAASAMEFPLIALPVKFISFTAKENTGNITLTWQNGDETGVDYYEVQKSTDGNHFKTFTSIPSNGKEFYSTIDNELSGNAIYYRVKAVSLNGSTDYTSILVVKFKNESFDVQISPNPTSQGYININLRDVKAGRYTVRIFNNAGKLAQATPLYISGGVSVQTVFLPPGSSKGLYYVQMKGEGILVNKTVIIQ